MASDLREQTLARLYFTANLIDLLISFVAVTALFNILLGMVSNPIYRILISLAVVLIVHLFLTEFVFGHRSIGKICLGLGVRENERIGGPAFFQRFRCFLSRLFRCSIDSFNFNQVPRLYKVCRLTPKSDLMADYSPISIMNFDPSELCLLVGSGIYQGSVVQLKQSEKFMNGQYYGIGRDEKWADLALVKENGISSRHCILKKSGKKLMLADAGLIAKPSTNKTWHNKLPLRQGEWVQLELDDEFHVADIKIHVCAPD